MERPDGITQEAWDAADAVLMESPAFMIKTTAYQATQVIIAKAIQSAVEAERERAARLAETYGANMSIWVSSEWPTAKLSGNYAGQDIAQAIRKGA